MIGVQTSDLQSDGVDRRISHRSPETTSLEFSTSLAAGCVLAKKNAAARFCPRRSTPNGDANTSTGHERP